MNIVSILVACLVVGVTGLIIGVLLGYAGKVFEVEVRIGTIVAGCGCGSTKKAAEQEAAYRAIIGLKGNQN